MTNTTHDFFSTDAPTQQEMDAMWIEHRWHEIRAIVCDICDGEGRILRGPDDRDHGACPHCFDGLRIVKVEPIEMEDLA